MYNALVVRRIDLTPQLVIFHVKPDAGVPDFEPGQYVALGLLGSEPRGPGFKPDVEEVKADKIIKRAYSIGSSPAQKDFIELYIALVDDGALTPRLAVLSEGSRLFMAPKIVGHFTLHDLPEEKNAVLVSTGTGIAPFMSMIRTPSCWTPGRRFTMVHGVRYVSDLAYREELLSLQFKDRLAYLPIVSRATEDWKGDRGHVQKLFEDGKVPLNPAKDHVFLCGNPAMIEGMQKLLESRGYTEHSKKHPGNMHLEKYW